MCSWATQDLIVIPTRNFKKGFMTVNANLCSHDLDNIFPQTDRHIKT